MHDCRLVDRDDAFWRRRQRLFYRLFPTEDTAELDGTILYAREKYPKHLEFFEAGATYRERCFMAANRVGKTLGAGGFATACHLTGAYPTWWPGRQFETPVGWWAAGKTDETTRDIVQTTLLRAVAQRDGGKHFDGTGVIPGVSLGAVTWKQGVSDLVDTITVRHVSGGGSTLGFKSYQQGRGSFEGTAQHGIWLDEEPPLDVYGECLIRTATTKRIIMLTFTPLDGMSEVVMGFLPEEMRIDDALRCAPRSVPLASRMPDLVEPQLPWLVSGMDKILRRNSIATAYQNLCR